jgi:hypothetical protein
VPAGNLDDHPIGHDHQIDHAKQARKMKGSVNQLNRFVVACEFRSGSRPAFGSALSKVGAPLQLSENLWLLRAIGTAGSIRNVLIQDMGARDTLMVLQLDAVRTATHNYGPELDARVRAALYLAPPEHQTATAAVAPSHH